MTVTPVSPFLSSLQRQLLVGESLVWKIILKDALVYQVRIQLEKIT